ncbi:hypothetical protein T03_856, partial [Trichinella britovi]
FTRSKSFTALSVRSSSSNSHYFNVCVEYQPFLSTDTDLINLIRFLWFLFSHTVSTLYTGIKQDPSSRGLLGSSKKYTIVFVYVIPYANSRFKRTIMFKTGHFVIFDEYICKTEFNRFGRIYRQVLLIVNYQSRNFETLRVENRSALSSSSNLHYFNVCVEYQTFLSTDTDLINLIRFL